MVNSSSVELCLWINSIPLEFGQVIFYMVIVADIGKAPDCGSGDCGFDSHLSPKLNKILTILKTNGMEQFKRAHEKFNN